jgi:hypothetical protein
VVGSGNMPWRLVNTFQVIKANKRLWIECVETGERVYTPPDFMRHRMQSREPMRVLAYRFTATGRYDIGSVVEFEARF